MLLSRRPVSSAVSACPPSCAMVTTLRVTRHSGPYPTRIDAAAAVARTNHHGGAAGVVVSRFAMEAPRSTNSAVCTAASYRAVASFAVWSLSGSVGDGLTAARRQPGGVEQSQGGDGIAR